MFWPLFCLDAVIVLTGGWLILSSTVSLSNGAVLSEVRTRLDIGFWFCCVGTLLTLFMLVLLMMGEI